MKEDQSDKWWATVFIVMIITMGGCLYGESRNETCRQREHTKQMEIQARMDSLKIVHEK